MDSALNKSAVTMPPFVSSMNERIGRVIDYSKKRIYGGIRSFRTWVITSKYLVSRYPYQKRAATWLIIWNPTAKILI